MNDDIRKYIPEVPDFGTKPLHLTIIHHTSGLGINGALQYLASWRGDDLNREGYPWNVGVNNRFGFSPGDGWFITIPVLHWQVLLSKRLQVFLWDYTDSVFFKPIGHDEHHFQWPLWNYPNRPGLYKDDMGKWKIISVLTIMGHDRSFHYCGGLAKWDENFYTKRKSGGETFLQSMLITGVLN